jgi:hypothetical protein
MVAGAGACESTRFTGSAISDLISANVVGGCLATLGAGESSFAGGGGGATTSGADSPKGPRGSDSKSRSSNLETMDCAKREPVGRRREAMGDVRLADEVRVVDALTDGLACDVEEEAERAAGGEVCADDPNRADDDASVEGSIEKLPAKEREEAYGKEV